MFVAERSNIYIYIYTHTYIYIYTHIYIHTHTHTQTHIYIYIFKKINDNENLTQVPRTDSLDSLRPQNKVYHLAKTTDVLVFFFFFPTDANVMQNKLKNRYQNIHVIKLLKVDL